MSFVALLMDRVFMVAALLTAAVLLSASVIGYDLLGDRNIPTGQQPTWVTPPVWSELFFGAVALGVGIYLFKRRSEYR